MGSTGGEGTIQALKPQGYTGESILWKVSRNGYTTNTTRRSPIFLDKSNNKWFMKFYHGATTHEYRSETESNSRVELCLFAFGDIRYNIAEVKVCISASYSKSASPATGVAESYNLFRVTEILQCFVHTVSTLSYQQGEALNIYCRMMTENTQSLHPALTNHKFPTLTQNLSTLLQDGLFADVVILVGDESIAAHKNILSARSNVFATMFRTEMSESLSNRVNIVGFPFSVVKGMLEFIYTDHTDITIEFSYDWLKISEMYELEGLRFAVENMITKNTSVQNAHDIYEASLLYKSMRLKHRTIQFIKRNMDRVMTTAAMTKLEASNPEGALELLAATHDKDFP